MVYSLLRRDYARVWEEQCLPMKTQMVSIFGRYLFFSHQISQRFCDSAFSDTVSPHSHLDDVSVVSIIELGFFSESHK